MTFLIKSILTGLILFVATTQLVSQNYYTHQFTVEDGLPSSDIKSIYKDSQGLLWIGTAASLCTYDGKKFEIIKTSAGKTLNKIWSITEDDQNNLWFGSHSDGIYKFDGKSFTHLTEKDGLSDNRIRMIYFSKKFNLIAVNSFNGVNIIKSDTIINSPTWMGVPDTTKSFISIADGADYIYFTCIDPINPIRYYPTSNEFLSVNDQNEHYPNSSLGLFVSVKGDTVFSLYPKGVRIFSKDTVIENLDIGQVHNMDEDRDGNIWMPAWSTKNRDLGEGVYQYNGKELLDFTDIFGITDNEIWTVYCDQEQDIIWIGTENEGLYQVLSNEQTNFTPEYFSLEQLKINDLFVDSNNTLWISDKYELICLKENGQYSFIDKRPMTLAFQQYWSIENRNVGVQIDSIHISLRHLKKGRLSQFESEVPFEFLHTIEADDGSIFFSCRFGLFSLENGVTNYYGSEGSEGYFDLIGHDSILYSGSGNTVLNPSFRDKSANIKSPEMDSIISKGERYHPLIEITPLGDRKNFNKPIKYHNKFWFASISEGLWMTNGEKVTDFNLSDSTYSNNLKDICFDEYSNVILATNEGDIYIGKPEGNDLKIDHHLNDQDGIHGNTINWLVTDKMGKLWLGTNLGLNEIDLKHLYDTDSCRTRFFDNEGGYNLKGSKNAVIDQNENLYIAASKSLIRFDTKHKISSRKHHIIVKSILINAEYLTDTIIRELNSEHLPINDLFKLKHKHTNIEFNFDILNYINPGKERFRYRLRNFDQNWAQWSYNRQAKFTNLKPGKYRLTIESYNEQSQFSSDPLEIEFKIPRPFWKLWYIQIIAYLILILITVYITRKIVDRRRLRQIRQSEIERKVLQLEMQALQAQMNPHFIFNCLTGIQYFVLENQTDEVMKYLSDFSKVIRVSLENANNTFLPLENEIDFLKSYLRLEQMRFTEKFSFEILTKNIPNGNSIRIPSMMIQPFAENSIKHGFSKISYKGKLSIEFEPFGDDIIKCTITDNGQGRANESVTAKLEKGNDRLHSTQITDMRLNHFNHTKEADKHKIQYFDLIENGENCGTKVVLFLPLK